MKLIGTAQFLGQGKYDLTMQDGSKPRYLDLYTVESGQVRFSVDKDCVLPDLKMGDSVTVGFVAGNSEKVVRGEERDRAIKSIRLVVSDVALASANKLRTAAAA